MDDDSRSCEPGNTNQVRRDQDVQASVHFHHYEPVWFRLHTTKKNGNRNRGKHKKTRACEIMTTSGTAEAGLSVQVYGEKTSLPITVRKAVVRAPDRPLPFLNQQVLVSVQLELVNETVNKNTVAAKLHWTLPTSASVKRFEIQRDSTDGSDDGIWYPATAVPQKQAATVVYKEKEKGRKVASVAQSLAASNVFEMELSPLPYQTPVQCRVELLLQHSDVEELVALLETCTQSSTSKTPMTVERVTISSSSSEDNDAKIMNNGDFDGPNSAGAVVGTCFGNKTHFVCHIPPLEEIVDDLEPRKPCTIRRMALFQDTSVSMISAKDQVTNRESRLRQLFSEAKCNLKNDETVVVEFYTFDMVKCRPQGVFSTADDLLHAMSAVDYEGGTNIPVLLPTVCELAERKTNVVDCALIVTDGVDSTASAASSIANVLPTVPFPVHCIADTTKIHGPTLSSLAAMCPSRPGAVFTKKDTSYLPGILYPRAILRRIQTNQSDQAFLQEIDDGFCCVPDHRLAVLNQPIHPTDGLLISGILADKDSKTKDERPDPVTELVAEIVVNGAVYKLCFNFDSSRKWETTATDSCEVADACTTTRRCPTLFLDDSSTEHQSGLAGNNDLARILGHLYAEHVYRQTQQDAIKSGMSLTSLLQEIATTYGFCSPESTLLMLYEREQFLEHDIAPPVGHPLEPELRDHFQKKVALSEKKNPQKHDGDSIPMGELGGLKNEGQRKGVVRLAKRLNDFFSAPPMSRKVLERAMSDSSMSDDPRRHRSASNVQERCYPGRRVQARCNRGRRRSFDEEDAESFDSSMHSGRSEVEEEVHQIGELRSGPEVRVGGFGRALRGGGRSRGSGLGGRGGGGRGERSRGSGLGGRGGGGRGDPLEESSTPGFPSTTENDSKKNSAGGDVSVATDDSTKKKCEPRAAEDYLQSLESRIQPVASGKNGSDERMDNDSDDGWKLVYRNELESYGGYDSASPSLYLNTARVLAKVGRLQDAIRIATNCLESGIDDAQMLRSVGYVLLSISTPQALGLAIAVFDKVKVLRPTEPQSFIDSSLSRFHKWWNACFQSDNMTTEGTSWSSDVDSAHRELATAQADLVHVLKHHWAERFSEVEWPVLILLHYCKELLEALRQGSTDRITQVSEWPSDALDLFRGMDDKPDPITCKLPLYCPKFDPALMVWLGWDTDRTDVDLHVKEPSGKVVYYDNNKGTESCLSRDFTEGYGPEVYLVKQNSETLPGNYDVSAKFYASHQDSALTGTTSAVVWRMEKIKTKSMDGASADHQNTQKSACSTQNRLKFDFVRLQTRKEQTHVATATIPS